MDYRKNGEVPSGNGVSRDRSGVTSQNRTFGQRAPYFDGCALYVQMWNAKSVQANSSVSEATAARLG